MSGPWVRGRWLRGGRVRGGRVRGGWVISGQLWLRQLRAEALPLLVLGVLLVGTSFLAVAVPRWLNGVADDAARHELGKAGASVDVLATFPATMPAEPGAATTLLQVRDDVLSSLDDPLPALLGPSLVAASTQAAPLLGSNDVERGAGLPAVDVTLTALVSPEPPVQWVDGAAPAASVGEAGPFALLETYGGTGAVRVVEVGLSAAPARAAGLAAGDLFALGGASPVVARVSGIFEPLDAEAYVWSRERNLLEAGPVYGANGIESYAVAALVPPESLDSLVVALATGPGRPGRLQVDLAYPVRVDQVDAAQTEGLRRAADRAESNPLQAAGAPIRVTTSVQVPLDRYDAQRSTAYGVIAVGLAGVAVSAVAVLVLAARLVSERRRTTLSLARARGASLRQLVVASGAEAGAVALVSVGAGALVATEAVPGRSSPTSWLLAVVLVVTAVVVAAAIVSVQHRTFAWTVRTDGALRPASLRRTAAEGGLVVLAVGGVLLLRRRGTATGGVAADPLLVAVPVLVSLALALLVLRLYPFPVRVLSRVADGRRGPVSFLGLSRAGRETATTSAPVVVLLVGLSFAIFASIVLHSVRVEQDVVAWETVGADLRVDGTDFDPVDDVPAIAAAAGVTAADLLGVHVQHTSTVAGAGGAKEFDLLLLDADAYSRFVADQPISGSPFRLLSSAPGGAGTSLPAVVSPGLASSVLGGDLGDVPMFLPGTQTTLTALDIAPAFPGYAAADLWAVARTTDADLVVDLPYAPSTLFLAAPDADPALVSAAVRERQPFARVVDREAVYDQVAAAPLVAATGTAFRLAIVVTAAYGLFAIALALVLAARPRSRFLSYLRTLGLADTQARWLVAWEILPPAVVALVVGGALGLALPRVILPAFDLRPFTGGLDAPPLVTDRVTVAILTLGLLGVVTAAVLVTTMVNRRRQLGAVLRVGEDS